MPDESYDDTTPWSSVMYAESVPPTFKFHIGDLVTLTSGVMVSRRGKRGLFEIVDYMTGRRHLTSPLFGNEFLPDAEISKRTLLRLYPWLREITVPDSVKDEATGRVFLDMVSARYGEYHQVAFAAAAEESTSSS